MIEDIILLAKKAGQAILSIYEENKPLDIHNKSDNTPVTIADLRAHEILKEGLNKIAPTIPVLSEEGANIPYSTRATWGQYWLLDPLDGTKEFIGRTGDFSINIALIVNHEPVLGVIYGPTHGHCYYAQAGKGAFKITDQDSKPIKIKSVNCDLTHLRVALSRRHSVEKMKEKLGHIPNIELTFMGSSLKSCLVAEGAVDLYARMGDTSEWDTAAAQCIVEEAGGKIMDLRGVRLQYNCKESLINPWFLVVGDPHIDWLTILKVGEV